MAQDETQHRPGAADAVGTSASKADRPPARPLDPMSKSSIETRLKSMYDEVASEPVPDRFLDLLNRLERSEDGGGDAR